MSKNKILILILLVLIFAIGAMYEDEPEKDKKMIQKAIEDVFDAYNSRDDAIITSILHKYINPYQYKLVFNGMTADMNSIIIN